VDTQRRISLTPEQTIVAKIASGDLQSLGLLFDRYEPDVRRLLRRLGVPTSDVDDLIQITFVQVIRASKGFDDRYAVRSWLLGIAAMMARRQTRTLGRIRAGLASWASHWSGVSSLTPGEAYDTREKGRRIQAALDRLSAKRREAFVLVTLEGVSGEEAAAVLGIPLNTLWTRLHHARRDLQRWLPEDL
jgi:RNA polymerase sigma-70 factor (ECF subfamily)